MLDVDESNLIAPVSVAGAAIERLSADPMPAMLRLGQRLFYSSNTPQYPITQNFWMSCSTCHLEGSTDGVTWLFASGPRDTPSNAGGPINTGFLMRQALRNSVTDYDVTIDTEQGGDFHRATASQEPLLDALAAFVNYAIPLPQNPNLAPGGALTASQQRGQATFMNACASCHSGPFYTDSGAGNPTLDFAGPILLHDIGTCVQNGPYNDEPKADDVDGAIHAACQFDTPTLRGIFATRALFPRRQRRHARRRRRPHSRRRAAERTRQGGSGRLPTDVVRMPMWKLYPLLALAAACTENSSGPGEIFIAEESDFAPFQSWTSFTLPGNDPLSSLVYPLGARQAFLNQRPPHGAREYPVGTLIVKAVQQDDIPQHWELFARAKRGGNFNPAGAVNWEFFLLIIDTDGTVRIASRGIAPQDDGHGDMSGIMSAGYFNGQGIIAPCNVCHGQSTTAATDHISSSLLFPAATAE